MKNNSYFLLLIFSFLLINTNSLHPQQIIDPIDVIAVDNTSDNNTGTIGTFMNNPKYREFPQTQIDPSQTDIYGWWSNTGTVWYGGNSRRASRWGSGNNTGAHAKFYCTVHNTDYYVVYAHMPYSGNASTRAYVKFWIFGQSEPVQHFYYNMQDNMITDPDANRGSWFPLGITQIFASDSALTVEIGLDSTGSNTLRTDGIKLLRSRQTGPDLEFGNRRTTSLVINPVTGDTIYNTSFYRQRAPLVFPQTTFKWNRYSDKNMVLYNLGGSDLVVSDFTFQTNRFSVITPTPITIAPGSSKNIVVRFSPKGEEFTNDTMIVHSNDSLEPESTLPLRGEGINYNFILNASLGGSEPHWNDPAGSGIYEEFGDTWLSSTPTPWPYPIPDGNNYSRVNTGANPAIAVFYRFNLPDSIGGNYYLEYSGPIGSPNACQNVFVDVVTPFVADTQKTNFNSRIPSSIFWARIGGNKVFNLQGGGQTTVRFMNPIQGGTELLRADLIRVRLIPLAPDISTNLDPLRLLNYGSVSVYDSIRQQEFNFQRSIVIGSNGETPLRIDSIRMSNSNVFEFANLPQFPLTLPAVDGEYNLLINFLPNIIQLEIDTVWIYSNDPQDSVIFVRLSGQGVGTGMTIDDNDPTTFIVPANVPIWDGGPDPFNPGNWHRQLGVGTNSTRLLTYIYINPEGVTETIEWFPNFPLKPGSTVAEPDSFDVWIGLPAGSSNSSPMAKYLIKSFDGIVGTYVNQNGVSQGGQVQTNGRVYLGRFTFIRGGQDSPGSGTIFGSIELINEKEAVNAFYADSAQNTALVDSFVLRADAIFIQQAGNPLDVIEVNPQLLPTEFSLSQNYPNPFNPTTRITYAVPMDGKVDLKIYDIMGREVATLVKGDHMAGYYTVEWDGRNNFGLPVSTGMYIYRMISGNFIEVKKMMLLK